MARQPSRQPAAPKAGPNVVATLATLRRLDVEPTTDALGALCLTLADTLDAGAGSQVANVARELRNALAELANARAQESPELDALLAELAGPGA